MYLEINRPQDKDTYETSVHFDLGFAFSFLTGLPSGTARQLVTLYDTNIFPKG